MFITARKRSLRRLCFYRCLSFILFTGGGVGIPACNGPTVYKQVPPRTRYTPTGTRQVHPPRTRYTPGTTPLLWDQVHPPGTTPPRPGTPPPRRSRVRHTVNARALRILLECILVTFLCWRMNRTAWKQLWTAAENMCKYLLEWYKKVILPTSVINLLFFKTDLNENK